MRRRWVVAFGTLLLLPAALPTEAAAQGGRRCNQTLPADARQLINAYGQEVVYFRDPVRMVCTGGLVIEADSAVFNRGEGAMQLVGSVIYRDSTRQLTADWANYLGGPDELYARGNVLLQDLADGSRVTGEELEFRRQTAERPQSLMIVRGGRPSAVLPPSTRDDEAPDTAAPVQVWGDRLQFIGETVFLAQGNAEIVRGDLEGAADTARFDQLDARMTLIGRGHVENPRYRLDGDRIDALLPGDTLREVHAEGDARLTSEELRVRSQRLRIELSEGELERLEAWNPAGLAAYRPAPAPPPAPDSAGVAEPPDSVLPAESPEPPRPARPARQETAGPQEPIARAVAVARDFTLRADSIEARAEGGQMREVRAVSRAFGEREADALAAALPVVTARDWIQGDTIVGYFAADTAQPPAAADSVLADEVLAGVDAGDPTVSGDTAEVVLERILVIGGSQAALSLYRMAADEPGAAPAINFMSARRIILHLIGGDVDRVEAEGPIDGLYLDPVPGGGARPPEEDEG